MGYLKLYEIWDRKINYTNAISPSELLQYNSLIDTEHGTLKILAPFIFITKPESKNVHYKLNYMNGDAIDNINGTFSVITEGKFLPIDIRTPHINEGTELAICYIAIPETYSNPNVEYPGDIIARDNENNVLIRYFNSENGTHLGQLISNVIGMNIAFMKSTSASQIITKAFNEIEYYESRNIQLCDNDIIVGYDYGNQITGFTVNQNIRYSLWAFSRRFVVDIPYRNKLRNMASSNSTQILRYSRNLFNINILASFNKNLRIIPYNTTYFPLIYNRVNNIMNEFSKKDQNYNLIDYHPLSADTVFKLHQELVETNGNLTVEQLYKIICPITCKYKGVMEIIYDIFNILATVNSTGNTNINLLSRNGNFNTTITRTGSANFVDPYIPPVILNTTKYNYLFKYMSDLASLLERIILKSRGLVSTPNYSVITTLLTLNPPIGNIISYNGNNKTFADIMNIINNNQL